MPVWYGRIIGTISKANAPALQPFPCFYSAFAVSVSAILVFKSGSIGPVIPGDGWYLRRSWHRQADSLRRERGFSASVESDCISAVAMWFSGSPLQYEKLRLPRSSNHNLLNRASNRYPRRSPLRISIDDTQRFFECAANLLPVRRSTSLIVDWTLCLIGPTWPLCSGGC